MTSVKHVHTKYSSSWSGGTDWKNVYVISLFAFIDAFQFAFFVWTFWPYVQQLDPTMSASFVGVIMAVSGIGEAVAAPIFGCWTNRCGKIVPPLIASIIISLLGNVLYMCLNAFPVYLRTPFLLISRFFNGAGSGNRGSYMAYIAAASTTEDRARSMALSGGGALIGLNVGPAVQMAFTWIGEYGVDVGFMRISMYTAPAILAIAINILCIFYLVFFLDDGLDRFNAPDSDTHSAYSIAAANDSDLERATVKVIRMDVLAVVICMLTRAARMLMTSNIESIGSPFSEVMFNLDKTEVLNYNSYMQAAVGGLTVLMFIVYAFTSYSKWISERMNCVVAMAALLVFHLLTFSWSFLPGHLTNCAKYTSPAATHKWMWCDTLKPVNMWLYYISYSLIFGIGLPCLNNSLQSLYSQILGKGRQGTMQGINQAVGCISRILGPILMSTTFSEFGPRGTWLIEIGLLLIFLPLWLITYRRLTPANERKEREISVVPNLSGKENLGCRRSSTASTSTIETVHDHDSINELSVDRLESILPSVNSEKSLFSAQSNETTTTTA
ncbi:hypothetical protein WR25_06891 [Diploscapter pachys]|uniref:Major facilitator superfamily (MFS) profile domain-containing protein n=1 Tax=Diploscapter pachys TaxID=2018661 RepID=A0A2A2L3N2_9BILA|nr:hypothetical protein WR25_06891 [Diploscapter pachys]